MGGRFIRLSLPREGFKRREGARHQDCRALAVQSAAIYGLSKNRSRPSYGERTDHPIRHCPRVAVRVGVVCRFWDWGLISSRLPDAHLLGPRDNCGRDFFRRGMGCSAAYRPAGVGTHVGAFDLPTCHPPLARTSLCLQRKPINSESFRPRRPELHWGPSAAISICSVVGSANTNAIVNQFIKDARTERQSFLKSRCYHI